MLRFNCVRSLIIARQPSFFEVVLSLWGIYAHHVPHPLTAYYTLDVLASAGLVDNVDRGCSLAPVCPRACRCGAGIVDCRDTGQADVPTHIPEDTIEL